METLDYIYLDGDGGGGGYPSVADLPAYDIERGSQAFYNDQGALVFYPPYSGVAVPVPVDVQQQPSSAQVSAEVLQPEDGPVVPGGIYTGYVRDEQGNPLRAGWFFIDLDGKQIMTDVIAEDGVFHFTVPLYNYQNIFVDIYATD